MNARTKHLVREAQQNPWRFFGADELAQITGLSLKAIRALADWGAPFVAKKSRPELLIEWMRANPEKIGKLE